APPLKERCKTPDSPEGARLCGAPGSASPTQSTSPRQNGGTVSPPSTSATTTAAVLVNGSSDSLTPPPLSVTLDGGGVATQQFNQAASSCSVTRPLVKVKRFLSTLAQFGNDIGPDIGERVRTLILNLVSSNLSIEEFHHSLQDVTNFPLRPFVLPFLRAHLPILQREIHGLARNSKQSALQYVRTHDHLILDSTHSPAEPSEIFLPNDAPIMTGGGGGFKRRTSDCSVSEQQQQHDGGGIEYTYPPTKRANFQNLLVQNTAAAVPSSHFFEYGAPGPAPQHQEAVATTRGDEEWRNIHVMLNCILSMVEKTKRALTILQQRNSQDLTNEWLRKQDVGVDLKKAANEIMLQAVRQTEDRVAEVRRRAEDAVNDVKRQAVVELQKAVAAAESKANELVATERAKMEKIVADARKHEEGCSNHGDAENSQSPTTNSQPQPSQQNCCWNCGRKAHETCSGCSVARYCGPFCQHKDWENHHQVCSKEKLRPLRSTTPVDPVKFKK
ncbi:PREDICTED: protein CBFA2T1, partial [Nicrophorus vespilloides]|uniref:Protein CBFA2T1 n=1 Tax=Nicrophorus vespilloides TaxID=110193 RepID=A0ABM1N1M9_NICVS